MANRKSFLIRIAPAILDELRRWASADLRSVNGQIEYILRDAIARRARGDGRGERADDDDQSSSSS